MYLQFLVVISDYFRSISKEVFRYEWLLPIMIALVIVLFSKDENQILLLKLCSDAVTLLGVLIAFSIATVTILVTSTSANVVEIKSVSTKYTIGTKVLSLFDLLHVNFTYAIIIEIVTVVISIVIAYTKMIDSHIIVYKLSFLFLLSLLFHILLLNIRNITDFYFVLSKEKKQVT